MFDNAYESIIEFIIKAKNQDLETEVTAVIVPEVEIAEIRKLAKRIGVTFSERKYFPLFW
jgi:hypothetical protein